MLGGAGSSVSIGDLNASNAAQSGVELVVTVDEGGTLGVQEVASSRALANVQSNVAQLAAVSDVQFANLSGQVTTLFDLTSTLQKDTRQGIAAVAAMAQPHFPNHG